MVDIFQKIDKNFWTWSFQTCSSLPTKIGESVKKKFKIAEDFGLSLAFFPVGLKESDGGVLRIRVASDMNSPPIEIIFNISFISGPDPFRSISKGREDFLIGSGTFLCLFPDFPRQMMASNEPLSIHIHEEKKVALNQDQKNKKAVVKSEDKSGDMFSDDTEHDFSSDSSGEFWCYITDMMSKLRNCRN